MQLRGVSRESSWRGRKVSSCCDRKVHFVVISSTSPHHTPRLSQLLHHPRRHRLGTETASIQLHLKTFLLRFSLSHREIRRGDHKALDACGFSIVFIADPDGHCSGSESENASWVAIKHKGPIICAELSAQLLAQRFGFEQTIRW